MAAIINVLFEGEIVPVPTGGITFTSELVEVAINKLRSKDTIRGGLNVYRISRDDGKALKRDQNHVPVPKDELDELDALDTAPFAGGAHLILLERKPGGRISHAGPGEDADSGLVKVLESMRKEHAEELATLKRRLTGLPLRAPDATAGSPWQQLAARFPRLARVLATFITPMEGQMLQLAAASSFNSTTWVQWLGLAYVMLYLIYMWGPQPPRRQQV